MEKGHINGMTIVSIKDNGSRIVYKEKGHIIGQMERHTLELGEIIRWMGLVLIHGKTEEFMKEGISTAKNLDMEYMYGQTVKDLKENG